MTVIETGDRVAGKATDGRHRLRWTANRRCKRLNKKRRSTPVPETIGGSVRVYVPAFMYRWEVHHDGERWAVVAMQNKLEAPNA